MKKTTSILGYLSALFLASTIASKVNRYPGEEAIMAITGILMSAYFPLYVLGKFKTINNGKIMSVNYSLAIAIFFVTLGATLKLSHLELGSLIILLGFGCFCLVYAPLLFIKKAKETEGNKLMYMAGISGMVVFPLGIFLRVYLGSSRGMHFFSLGIPLIFFIFLPIYFTDKSLTKDQKEKRVETTLYTIIIGAMLFFSLFRTVYPPKIESQTNVTPEQTNH